MINLKYFTLAVFIFCLISLISFGWSAEKPKVPSGAIGIPAAPTQAIPLNIAIMPFDIKVDDKTSKYLHAFSLSARLVPRNDSQYAKGAISGKTVTFYADDKFVGTATSGANGVVQIDISENLSSQLNLQVGIHTILAHATHEGHVIKGNGTLGIEKASPKFAFQSVMPVSDAYALGQTVTLGAILTTAVGNHPITHVNVDCISINISNGSIKTLKTVQTNNQGGFECPITLTQDVFAGNIGQCNLQLGWIGASFVNQNFMKTIGEYKIIGCLLPGMHPSNSCPPGCERVTGPPLCCK